MILTLAATEIVIPGLLGKIAGWVTGFGIIAEATRRWIIRPIKKLKLEWKTYVDKIDHLTQKIDVIDAEFRPNHGTTLRDGIDRMYRKILFLDQQTKVLLTDDSRAIFISDAKGSCIWMNRAYTAFTGRAAEQLLGFGWKNAIEEAARDRVIQEWESAIEEHREFHMKYNYEHLNGEIFPVDCSATPIKTVDDILMGYVGTVKRREAHS